MDIQDSSSTYQGISDGELQENYQPVDSAFSNDAYTGLDDTKDSKYYELETPRQEEPVYNILEKANEDDNLYQDPNNDTQKPYPVVPPRVQSKPVDTSPVYANHEDGVNARPGEPHQEDDDDYYSAAWFPKPTLQIDDLYAPVIKPARK